MRLPTLADMLQTRATVAESSDFGPQGTKRVGKFDAKRLVVVTALVYEGELNALAAMWVLLENPSLLRSDVQAALVLARPEEREVAANMNRVSDNDRPDTYEFSRIDVLFQAFGDTGATMPIAVLDVQENSQPATADGWVMDIRRGSQLCDATPSPLRIEGVTHAQYNATETVPFGAAIFLSPTIEVLAHAHNQPGGIKAAVKAVLSVLAGLDCLAEDVMITTEKSDQRVLEVVGTINVPDSTKSYTLDSSLLTPFAPVNAGQIVGRSTDGTIEVQSPRNGVLCLGPSKTDVSTGRQDPFFYLAVEQQPRKRTLRYPTWLDTVG